MGCGMIAMQCANIDDYIALNQQLSGLLKAGVPMGSFQAKPLSDAILEISTRVTGRVGSGESFESAFRSEAGNTPSVYQSLVEAVWRGGSRQELLAHVQRLGDSLNTQKHQVWIAFCYPIIVCCLAVLGIMSVGVFVAPILEGVYEEFRIPERRSLEVLGWIGAVSPPMCLGGVLAGILFYVTRPLFKGLRKKDQRGMHSGERSDNIVFNSSQGKSCPQRTALYCEALGTLLEAKVNLQEAMLLAAGISGDKVLVAASRTFAATHKDEGSLLRAVSDQFSQFPPFLRWVLTNHESHESFVDQKTTLWLAADIYRSAASQHADWKQSVMPVVACIFIAGGATLAFAITLFLPLSEMFKALAR